MYLFIDLHNVIIKSFGNFISIIQILLIAITIIIIKNDPYSYYTRVFVPFFFCY